jgi:acylphosphatase
MPRVHVIVRGQVQGVGYRWFAARQARHHALTGWIRNRADGSVEAEVEGPRAALETLLAEFRRGPAHAVVSGVEAEWNDSAHGHTEFEILD